MATPQDTVTDWLIVVFSALAAVAQKLGDDPARPRFIVTESGLGYRWRHDPDQGPPGPSTA